MDKELNINGDLYVKVEGSLEPEYSPGDKVRVIKEAQGVNIGDILTVYTVHPCRIGAVNVVFYIVIKGCDTVVLLSENIEPYQEKPEPLFKERGRVVYNIQGDSDIIGSVEYSYSEASYIYILENGYRRVKTPLLAVGINKS